MSSKQSSPDKKYSEWLNSIKPMYEHVPDLKTQLTNYASPDSFRSNPSSNQILDKYRTPSSSEADLKYALLKAENDRLTNLNKSLFSENESLRFGKSQKELDLESKLGILIDETENLNKKLVDREKTKTIDFSNFTFKETDELRKQLTASQQDKMLLNDQISRLQADNDDLRRKYLSSSSFYVTSEENNRKLSLATMENEALKKSCETLQRENTQLSIFLKEKSTQLEKALLNADTLQKENTDVYKNVSGLKSQLITVENNLNQQISSVMTENNELKRRLFEFETKSSLLSDMTNRNITLNEENKKLANALNEQMKIAADADNLRMKVALLIQENERLMNVNSDKLKEVSLLKAQNDSLNMELNRAKEELTLKGTTTDYEIQALRRKSEELSKKTEELGSLKGQLSVLTLDNDRLLRALDDKKKENETLTKTRDDWIRVSGELEGWKRKYEVISIDYKRIEDELKSLRNSSAIQYDALKNQNTGLLADNQRLSDELNSLLRSSGTDSGLLKMRNEEINARNKELDEIRSKMSLLVLENERHNRSVESLSLENGQLKTTKDVLSKELESQRNINVDLNFENKTLKEELSQVRAAKDIEISTLKKQNDELAKEKNSLVAEINRRGNASEAELSILRKKAEELSELRANVAVLALENDRLHRLIISLNFELEKNDQEFGHLKQRIDELIRENDSIRVALHNALRDLDDSQLMLREFQKKKQVLDDARSRVKNMMLHIDDGNFNGNA
jgi:chromosome segregation ATPase